MNAENKDIYFSCGCREWTISPTDEKGVTEQPENTVIDHQCGKVIVYRTSMAVKRFFRRV